MSFCPKSIFPSARAAAAVLAAALMAAPAARAADAENIPALLDRWLIWSDSGTMVVRHLTDEVIGHLDTRAAAIAKLRTREEWEERRHHARAALDRIIGTLPHRQAPLNPRVTGMVRKEGYRIEKIVFESLPKMYVTGCLLIPDGLAGPAPAILYTAGSSDATFRRDIYQQHILNLVRNGFIVFAIDPIGQGERFLYHDPATNKSPVSEFEHAALQSLLIGSSYAKFYIRDAMRAIDYLQTRPEVDPGRLGMGGLSWGGWQCTLVTALDDRIQAGASAAGCNVGIRRWYQSMGPTGVAQQYLGFVTAGLDHADFFEQMAPRAFLRMSTTRDYKVIQGARETYDEYSRAFAALGASHKLDFTEDDAGHGYTPKNNEAAYRFYAKHLSHPSAADFKPMPLMTQEDMQVTPTGQVVTSYADAALAFDFIREEAEPLWKRLASARSVPASHLAEVRAAAKRLAGIKSPQDEVAPMFLGRYRRAGYAVELYVLQGEVGYVIPLHLYVPEGTTGARPAVIYVHPDGKAAVAKANDEVERLVRKGCVVAVPDLAGTGETRNKRGEMRALQYIALMIDRSIPGLQAADVMRVRAFLQSRPEGHEINRIGLVGFGTMGPALLHAAALDPALAGLVLVDASLSYRPVVTNKFYKMEVAEMVFGALLAYDLPDLVACVAPRRVALISSRDHLLQPASAPLAAGELAFPRTVFESGRAGANLRVAPGTTELVPTIEWMLQ